MKSLNEFLNEAKDVGHYERIGNQTIVDSNFVNYSKGCLPDSELVHLGMGDFQLKTPKGNITFNRSGKIVGIGQDFVGRPHRATDDKGGKVLEELIKVMTKKKKAVLSMAGLDESKKEITKYHKAAKKAGANKLSKIEPEYDDLYGHSFTFVDSDGTKTEIYYDKDQEGVAISQFYSEDEVETDDISIDSMLKLIEQSRLDESKKPVTDKYGWHIKPFFKEGEKVLYYGEPAEISRVRDDGNKVTYDVKYTNQRGSQSFVNNKSGEIKKLNEAQSYAASFGGSSQSSEMDTDKFKEALNKVKLDLVSAKGLWDRKNIVNSKNKVVSQINTEDSTYRISKNGRSQWYNFKPQGFKVGGYDKVIKHILGSLDEINQYTGEAEKSEKYWDTKFKKAIKLFPTWADEKVDITNEIRQVYNERILDVTKGDKGYVEPISRYEGDVEIYIEMATDLWNKMKGDVIAKEYALEDYVRWLK